MPLLPKVRLNSDAVQGDLVAAHSPASGVHAWGAGHSDVAPVLGVVGVVLGRYRLVIGKSVEVAVLAGEGSPAIRALGAGAGSTGSHQSRLLRPVARSPRGRQGHQLSEPDLAADPLERGNQSGQAGRDDTRRHFDGRPSDCGS